MVFVITLNMKLKLIIFLKLLTNMKYIKFLNTSYCDMKNKNTLNAQSSKNIVLPQD